MDAAGGVEAGKVVRSVRLPDVGGEAGELGDDGAAGMRFVVWVDLRPEIRPGLGVRVGGGSVVEEAERGDGVSGEEGGARVGVALRRRALAEVEDGGEGEDGHPDHEGGDGELNQHETPTSHGCSSPFARPVRALTVTVCDSASSAPAVDERGGP